MKLLADPEPRPGRTPIRRLGSGVHPSPLHREAPTRSRLTSPRTLRIELHVFRELRRAVLALAPGTDGNLLSCSWSNRLREPHILRIDPELAHHMVLCAASWRAAATADYTTCRRIVPSRHSRLRSPDLGRLCIAGDP